LLMKSERLGRSPVQNRGSDRTFENWTARGSVAMKLGARYAAAIADIWVQAGGPVICPAKSEWQITNHNIGRTSGKSDLRRSLPIGAVP